MSSIEKQEIVQNTPFSIIAGLAIGGPAGAIMMAAVSAGMAAIQENNDKIGRQLEWARKHPDPFKVSKEKEKIEKQWLEKQETLSYIKEIMNFEEPAYITISDLDGDDNFKDLTFKEKLAFKTAYNKTLSDNYNSHIKSGWVIKNDLERNFQFGYYDYKYVNPETSPYIKIAMYKDRNACILGSQPILESRGCLFNINDFVKKLLQDIHNPNFEKYCLIYVSNRSDLKNVFSCKYMYTIDGGRNFVVCFL